MRSPSGLDQLAPNWVLEFWESLHCISEPIVGHSENARDGSRLVRIAIPVAKSLGLYRQCSGEKLFDAAETRLAPEHCRYGYLY